MAALLVLEKIKECDPQPSEIWIHIDLADGMLEGELHRRFPNIRVLTSATRLGPGGGRHRCLQACTTPYAVSFDDDSYPLDSDFFSRVERLFSEHTRAAILAASIWHRFEPEKIRTESLVAVPSYIGCGYGIRLTAYREVRGYLPRAIPYGMEESDLSFQFYASGWSIYEAGDLRVFHDTELKHHQSPEITAGTIANVALCVFLHYPVIGWGRGVLQVVNKIAYCIRVGRLRGICSGILKIPFDCYSHRHYRRPIPWRTIRRFLKFCRNDLRQLPSNSSQP